MYKHRAKEYPAFSRAERKESVAGPKHAAFFLLLTSDLIGLFSPFLRSYCVLCVKAKFRCSSLALVSCASQHNALAIGKMTNH